MMMLVTTTAGVTGSEPLLPGKYESNGFIIWHFNSNEQTIDDINAMVMIVIELILMMVMVMLVVVLLKRVGQ